MPPARLLITASAHRVGKVVSPPRRAAGVDQPGAAHIGSWPAGSAPDRRVIAGQFAVHPIVGIAEVNRFVAAVILRHLLPSDIGADGGRQVVGLTGQVSGNMIVDAVFLERRIAQIGPQHGDQAQLMGPLKGGGNLFYPDDAIVLSRNRSSLPRPLPPY